MVGGAAVAPEGGATLTVAVKTWGRVATVVLFGALGVAVLAQFGFWQLDRLRWKEDLLARIEAGLAAEPGPLPPRGMSETRYIPVQLQGIVAGDTLQVFGTWRDAGAGYRLVAPVATSDGRRVMVDFGVVPEPGVSLPNAAVRVSGVLDHPEEINASTPPPEGLLWFARDVPAMAAALRAEPVLVVASEVEPPLPVRPVPVGTAGIPNNHLGYAIQWFGLAIVWAGMTAYLAWRITRRTA